MQQRLEHGHPEDLIRVKQTFIDRNGQKTTEYVDRRRCELVRVTDEQVKHQKRTHNQNSSLNPDSKAFLDAFETSYIPYQPTQQLPELFQNAQLFRLKPELVADLDPNHKIHEFAKKPLSWLPPRVAIKTYRLNNEQREEKLRGEINEGLNEFVNFYPEIISAYAYVYEPRTGEFSVYYEFSGKTLEQTLQERLRNNREYFEESLLWKALYFLFRGITFLYQEDKNRQVQRLTPDVLLYDENQVSMFPEGIFPEFRQRQQVVTNLQDHFQQIGFTILQMGLLIPSNEFNPQNVNQYLADFGNIYCGNTQERLLHYVMTQLLRDPAGHNVYTLLKKYEQHIFFLNLFKLKKHLKSDYGREPQYMQFIQQYNKEI